MPPHIHWNSTFEQLPGNNILVIQLEELFRFTRLAGRYISSVRFFWALLYDARRISVYDMYAFSCVYSVNHGNVMT